MGSSGSSNDSPVPTERPALPGSLWLIGLMGSGKSTVGRAVADATGRHYVDNDATIAALARRSTAALSADVPSTLHTWESAYVRHLLDASGGVVAGIPASSADRAEDLSLLAARGVLVYLRCSPATLVDRVLADPPRPWLTSSRRSTEAQVAAMFAARDSELSSRSHLTLDAERPVELIVADLLDFETDRAPTVS